MAPKTRFADSPPISPPDSPDRGSQQSNLDPTQGILALLLKQMTRLEAYLDSRSAAIAALPAAGAQPHPLVAQRRHDAQLEHFRDSHDMHTLPLLVDPQPGYALPHAQSAFAAATVAAHVGGPAVAQRRPDAHREPSRPELTVEAACVHGLTVLLLGLATWLLQSPLLKHL
jgi:hypothetical protein